MNEDLYLHGIGGSGDVGYASAWVRPADWLPIPSLTDTDNKMVALVAVQPTLNYVAIRAQGAFTIDWGDGTVENFATGAYAYHSYDYTNPLLANTLSSRGYRQAILTLTPQAGQTLTLLQLSVSHPTPGSGYDPGFLDLEIAGALLNTLTLGVVTTYPTPHYGLLERVAIHKNAVTSWTAMFANCGSLRSLPVCYTAAGTNFSSMFLATNVLQSVPLMDTSNGTTFASMFSGASSLLTLPPLNTSKGTDFSSMLINCSGLLQVPLLDTSQATTVASMYSGCTRITTVPALNFPKATSLYAIFSSCSALLSVPDVYAPLTTRMDSAFSSCTRLVTLGKFTLGSCTNFASAFLNCYSLQTAPDLDTSKATAMGSMFSGCRSLTSVPAYNTKWVTDFSNMFYGCQILQKIPTFDTSSGLGFANMFTGCYSLYEIPPMSLKLATSTGNLTTPFYNAFQISKITITAGPSYSFSLSNYNKFSLVNSQLEAIFDVLPIITGQTLTLSTCSQTGYSLSGTTTAGSNQVAMASTANLAVGMCAVGTGLPAAADQSVTLDSTQGIVTHNNHGLSQNAPVVVSSVPVTASVNSTALPSTGAWNGTFAYGNGRLVATKVWGSTALAVSTDSGVTWTAAALPTSGGRNIAFGAGLFVVLGTGGGGGSATYYTSPDGVTWTTRSLGITTAFQYASIVYWNGKFFALASDRVISSVDGLTWTIATTTNLPSASAGTSYAYDFFTDGTYLYMTSDTSSSASFYKTLDGVTWLSLNGPSGVGGYRIAYGNGIFVALISAATTGYAYWSVDGVAWTGTGLSHPMPATGCNTLVFANGLFYAFHNTAASGGLFAVSADGFTWTTVADPLASSGWSAAFAVGETVFALTNQTGNAAVASVKASSALKVGRATYFPVTITANSYQLAATKGGAPLAMSGTGTALPMTVRVGAVIDAITPNTSVTLSAPATASGTATLSFRALQTVRAIMRGWAVVN